MAIEIRDDSRDSRTVQRIVTVSILVCPGVETSARRRPHSPNQHLRRDRDYVYDDTPGRTKTNTVGAVGVSEAQLDRAISAIRAQARRAWARPFTVEEASRRHHREARRYRYRVVVRLEKSGDKVPVLGEQWAGRDDQVHEDDVGQAGRRHASVWTEMQARNVPNVAIVHPNLGAQNPHGTVLRTDGSMLHPDWTSSPMGACCNLIRLGIQPALENAESLTAAHEVGHLMGLGHARRVRGAESAAVDARFPIMLSMQNAPRVLAESDCLQLHHVAQTFTGRQGVARSGAGGAARAGQRGRERDFTYRVEMRSR